MKTQALILAIILLSATVWASQEPRPVIYGEAYDNIAPADGETVTAYPEGNPADYLTDIVGTAGNTGLSGYWKINTNNFQASVMENDTLVIELAKGQQKTERKYIISLQEGTHYIYLNLDPAYQDYDDDGYMADQDCDDTDPLVNSASEEICGDGIDQDCDGIDPACYEASITMYDGWTLFALPYKPSGIDDSEALGAAIEEAGNADCDVIMTFDEESQQMIDDILGLDDPDLLLEQAQGYFIHCESTAQTFVYSYSGTLWE